MDTLTGLAGIGGIFIGNGKRGKMHASKLKKGVGQFELVKGIYILVREVFHTDKSL